MPRAPVQLDGLPGPIDSTTEESLELVRIVRERALGAASRLADPFRVS